MCLLLLDNGADVNATDAYGETPLTRAVEGQSAPICRLLLKRGADPTRFNHHGLTALHVAAACGLADFFAPLVKVSAPTPTPNLMAFSSRKRTSPFRTRRSTALIQPALPLICATLSARRLSSALIWSNGSSWQLTLGFALALTPTLTVSGRGSPT